MPTITVRFTVLNPVGGNAWDGVINDSVTHANSIFSARTGGAPFVVREALPRFYVPQADCERLLTEDIRAFTRESGTPAFQQSEYDRYRRLAASQGREFQVNAAGPTSVPGANVLSSEARGILALNRHAGEVAVYWVPSILEGSAHTICMPFYRVMPSEECIFMTPVPSRTTLAHEIGHLLMETGHCAAPAAHAGTSCANTCAPPANLMHWYEQARSGTSLNSEQWTRFETIGRRKGYF